MRSSVAALVLGTVFIMCMLIDCSISASKNLRQKKELSHGLKKSLMRNMKKEESNEDFRSQHSDASPQSINLWNVTTKNEWSETFSLETCQCKGDEAAVNEWILQRLLGYMASTADWRKQIVVWFMQNKSVGGWWMNKVFDRLSVYLNQYAVYLDNLRATILKVGLKTFSANQTAQVDQKLENLLSQANSTLQAMFQEGETVLAELQNPKKYAKELNETMSYKGPNTDIAHHVFGNSWMQVLVSQAGVFIVEQDAAVSSWFTQKQVDSKIWRTALDKILQKIYQEYIRLLEEWYNVLYNQGFTAYNTNSSAMADGLINGYKVYTSCLVKQLYYQSMASYSQWKAAGGLNSDQVILTFKFVITQAQKGFEMFCDQMLKEMISLVNGVLAPKTAT